MLIFSAEFTIDQDSDVVFITQSGYAEFTSHVPLHTFTGESNYLAGMVDFEENIVDFYLDLNTLETGIDRRDRDMYRTLNVAEFPFAEFSGSFDSSVDQNSTEKQTVSVAGEFTIHGITNEVEIEGTVQILEDEVLVEAAWVININDYDIKPPGILFYRVNEEQEVRIKVRLKPHPREEI